MKIPLKEAINSSAWYHCKTKCWVATFDDEKEIDYRVKVLSFEKINLEEVDEPNEIKELNLSGGTLWLLRVEVVNLWKKELDSFPIYDSIILIDHDDFEFKPQTDRHLTGNSEYAHSAGLNLLNGSSGSDCGVLLPKIPLRGSLAFLLPNDEEGVYFLSVEGGKIQEV